MSEVWGTFAVNDHLLPGSFVRDVLLFDRLVIPVPATAEERERWRSPNEDDPSETWDPDHLEAVLKILGTQRESPSATLPLAWVTDWSKERWQAERSRGEVANVITSMDAFFTTRLVLSMDETLPAVVEAVAAYPSQEAFRHEAQPVVEPPSDLSATEALLVITYPLLCRRFQTATRYRRWQMLLRLPETPTSASNEMSSIAGCAATSLRSSNRTSHSDSSPWTSARCNWRVSRWSP